MNIVEIKKRSIEITEYMHYADKEEIRRQDTLYLLSIIEQAEKAFEEINYQFELHEHEVIDNAIKKVDDIATEALQAIRGGISK